MSLSVAEHEHRTLRIFRLSAALHNALDQSGDLVPLETALGAIIAKPDDVQIIAPDSLEDMSLSQFLTVAYDVGSAELARQKTLQETTKDSFAIIRAGAFSEAAVTLSASPDATLIATLREGGPDAPSLTPLQSESAKGAVPPTPTKPLKSDARIGGMVATFVLLFLFALVGMMIWIAS